MSRHTSTALSMAAASASATALGICALSRLNCHALSFTAMCERSFLLWDTTGSFQLALSFSLRTCATLRSSGSYPASGGTSRPCPAFALMASVPLLAVTSPFRGAYVPYARSSRASCGFAALPTGRSVRRITGRREKEQIAPVHSHCRMYCIFFSPKRVSKWKFLAVRLKVILSFSFIPAEVIQSNTIVFCDFFQF